MMPSGKGQFSLSFFMLQQLSVMKYFNSTFK